MIEFARRRWHRLRQKPLPEVGPLRPMTLCEDDPLVRRVRATAPMLERILRENILPFWLGRTLDHDKGGYLLNHDGSGAWKGPSEKHCIPQARMVWFFSRAFRGGHLPEGLSAAEHGVRFLRERLRDGEYGGYYWAVSHDGAVVTDDSKRLYAQAFALYALAEYARVSGASEAASDAADLVEVFRRHFHDPPFGGFLPERTREFALPPLDGPRGETVLHKTVNDHLHVLEAFSAHESLEPDPWVRERLTELVLILTGSALRKTVGASSDRHRRDWTPLLGRGQDAVSYGHDLEAVWLVEEACRRVGIPFSLVADWGRSLLESTIRWGWDRGAGGVFFSGPPGGPAHTRRKVWWVQAEALVAFLAAFRLTGDPRYADFYLRTLDWIESRHVDWEGGDWHPTLEADGRVTGDKAGLWRSAYHNGRAMIQCLDLLAPGKGPALPSP